MNPTSSSHHWIRIGVVILVVVGLGLGGWYAIGRTRATSGRRAPGSEEAKGGQPIAVEIVHTRAGGIQRLSVQPGTVEPFEAADLYAKVSGFLVEQSVDIGSRVHAGEVLARIYVPEYVKQVERNVANVNAASARVEQMKAHKIAAEADARAADASVVLARVMVRAKTAYRGYREKQLTRVKELVAKSAVDERLRDEQEDYYLSALESENAAHEQVNTAQERASAARAKIAQAEADLTQARAEVGVAEAELAKSRALLEYTVIKSPFTGVVTKRNFNPGEGGHLGEFNKFASIILAPFHLSASVTGLPGDFIKAADQGGTVPLLAVERTDLMRVVVQVPDRDVPYVNVGNPAIVEIDALPGVVFQTKGENAIIAVEGGALGVVSQKHGENRIEVSRLANAEDPATRTMRTEVDVRNPDVLLRHGMYGRVTLILRQPSPNALRIPSAALVGKAEGGRGAVRVVRDGKVHVVPVHYVIDNGVEVEIASGLDKDDQVIVSSTGSIEEGSAISVHEAQAGGH